MNQQQSTHPPISPIPGVCIIVLNWRDAPATLACLDSLAEVILSGLASVVVCDNHSEDGSIAAIEAWAAKIALPKPALNSALAAPFTLIQTGKNGGYAFGNNHGIRFALHYSQFEFIWILNNDTQIEVGSLDALLKYAYKYPDADLIGSTVVDMLYPDLVQCAGGCHYYSPLSISQPVGKGVQRQKVLSDPHQYSAKIDYIIGAAFFIRRSLIDKIGFLSEDYFLYFEELDYVRRMKRAKCAFRWCPDSVVRHANQTPNPSREYHAHRSVFIFTAKWHWRFFPIILLLRTVVRPILMLLQGQAYLVRGAYRGMWDFLKEYRPLRHRYRQESKRANLR
ncbi:MAG: glycosyltransferase family 2 protein [Pseudomonadota bacterium]